MGTYYPAPTKPTPVDTAADDVGPIGAAAVGGGSVNPGSAAPPDHGHLYTPPIKARAQTLSWSTSPLNNGTARTDSQNLKGFAGGKIIDFSNKSNNNQNYPAGSTVGHILVYDPQTDRWSFPAVTGWSSADTTLNVSAGNMGQCSTTDAQGRCWVAVYNAQLSTAGHAGYFTPPSNPAGKWTFTLVPNVPRADRVLGLAVVGSLVYCAVANGANVNIYSYPVGAGATGAWSLVTSHATAKNGSAGGSSGLGGGCVSMASIGTVLYVVDGASNLFAWDTVAAAWSTLAAMPASGLNEAYCAAGDGSRYIMVINPAIGPTSWLFEVYDTVANAWLAGPVSDTDATTHQCDWPAMGGGILGTIAQTGGSATGVFESFDPAQQQLMVGQSSLVFGGSTFPQGVGLGSKGLAGTGLTEFAGTGVPPVGLGANGDTYFRNDGAAGAFIYQKRAGAWVASAA